MGNKEFSRSGPKTQWVKNKVKKASFKKIMLIFIALLVSELTLQRINPGHHRVPLFIGSLNIFHTQVGF